VTLATATGLAKGGAVDRLGSKRAEFKMNVSSDAT
jgi:hypothetical protein